MQIGIAKETDIEDMVALSYLKRKSYEKAQPQFWRYAEGAEQVQSDWFKELLARDDHILLIAKDTSNKTILGFIIGRIITLLNFSHFEE